MGPWPFKVLATAILLRKTEEYSFDILVTRHACAEQSQFKIWPLL